jgi:MFS transporter, DHA1 family, tetracycline resistance protein
MHGICRDDTRHDTHRDTVSQNRRFLPAYLLTLVNVLGFSLLMPVLPFVVEQYDAPKSVYGLLLSCYAFFQFIGAPWLGRLSDSLGRKPVLMISQFGTLLSWVIFGAAYFIDGAQWGFVALPLVVIALSRILDGITGGNNAVAQAYVADITTHREKGWIFGTLGGITGLGMIIGPGIGGFLASGPWGYLGVTICGALLSAITLLSIHLSLSESLPNHRRKPRRREPLSNTFRLIHRIKCLNPPTIIKQLFLVRALFSSMMASYIATIALFMIDLFEFTPKTLGMFMFFVGFFLAFNQAVVSKWMVRQTNELFTLKLGLALASFGMVAISQTQSLWIYICFYYVLNLGVSLAIPTFHALVAQHAGNRDTGEIMGIGDGIISLSNAVFPIFAASIYAIIGATFFQCIASLPMFALVTAWRIQLPQSKPDTKIDRPQV